MLRFLSNRAGAGGRRSVSLGSDRSPERACGVTGASPASLQHRRCSCAAAACEARKARSLKRARSAKPRRCPLGADGVSEHRDGGWVWRSRCERRGQGASEVGARVACEGTTNGPACGAEAAYVDRSREALRVGRARLGPSETMGHGEAEHSGSGRTSSPSTRAPTSYARNARAHNAKEAAARADHPRWAPSTRSGCRGRCLRERAGSRACKHPPPVAAACRQ